MARLATVGTDGRPHLVPVCFVLLGDVVYHTVDEKPKRHRHLRRQPETAGLEADQEHRRCAVLELGEQRRAVAGGPVEVVAADARCLQPLPGGV
ncbi:pyridoxamine 5'-phosphate oxidase family protein [Micromonospora soli]|uniref:pyridoxamine 5'-phosphate oxidase family protein n=1 Tax=Micromonospora sp. NBRC 110009 TaxID=3061627 RepID=UPI002671E188|nr:pyridoxamine 5'-phosphate oxidase family protein [Micromonospora sp. NBRC 110009]WKU02371.1 pyridoxamine 5'-phosphate oxidase family protein [Micromonospora sp. NBRC 110009]